MTYEFYRGESQSFELVIENEPSTSTEVSISIIRSNTDNVIVFSTKDGTLVKEGTSYKAELTKEQSEALLPSRYTLEGKVESRSQVTIQPLGEIIVKSDQVYKV